MWAVRANATTGFKSGKAAISGRRVKPVARRAGTTSSSALQMVGVSNALRASRSASSGSRGIAGFLEPSSSDHAFMGNGRRHQGISARYGSCPDQQTERDHQRQNDERDCETALRATPSLPIRNPILHLTASPGPLTPGRALMTDRHEKN